MVDIPNVKAAEPIPSQVMSEITDLMNNGDLFRYNSEGSAAHRLEIEFSKPDIQILNSRKDILNQFGLDFDLESEKININAVPSFVNIDNLKEIFENLIYNIQNEIPDNSFSESDLICKIMSKSMSIRNGKSLDLKEQQYIINSLFACKETMICPFNLKTYVQINYSEIENMFK